MVWRLVRREDAGRNDLHGGPGTALFDVRDFTSCATDPLHYACYHDVIRRSVWMWQLLLIAIGHRLGIISSTAAAQECIGLPLPLQIARMALALTLLVESMHSAAQGHLSENRLLPFPTFPPSSAYPAAQKLSPFIGSVNCFGNFYRCCEVVCHLVFALGADEKVAKPILISNQCIVGLLLVAKLLRMKLTKYHWCARCTGQAETGIDDSCVCVTPEVHIHGPAMRSLP